MGKDGLPPSVPENWFDLMMKKGGENRFWEHVRKNEISTYPTPPTDYSQLSIGFENRSCNRFEIPTNFVLKLDLNLEKSNFHRPSLTQILNLFKVGKVGRIRLWENLHMQRLFLQLEYIMLCELLPNFLFIERKRVEVWCSILIKWSIASHYHYCLGRVHFHSLGCMCFF